MKKTCAHSFICTVPDRGQYRHRVFGPSRRSIHSEHESLLLSIVHFSPNSTLTCCHSLLVVRFPQVFIPQNRSSKDFAHEVHLFGYRLPLFSFPNSFLYQVHPENFMCVLPQHSIPFLQLSVKCNSFDLSFKIHNLGRFSSKNSNSSLSSFFSRPRAEVTSHISACRHKQRMPPMHLIPDL